MALENINSIAIEKHKKELELTLEEIREETKDLKMDIQEIDKIQLKKVIDKNLKDGNGNWKKYGDMVKSAGYNFIVQAIIDLLGKKDKALDLELKKSGGIDMNYGKVTTKLVKKIQTNLGLIPDGRAGENFFSAILECLDGKRERKSQKKENTTERVNNKDENIELNKKNYKTINKASQITEKPKMMEPKSVEPYNGYFCSGPDFRRLEEPPVAKDVESFSLGGHISTIGGFPELNNAWKDGENITGDICVAFGAGTDGTPCKNPSKRFNEIEFEKKRKEIINFVSKSKLNNYNKNSILRLVRNCDFGTRGPKKLLFSNEWLLGMRNLECIKGIIESFNKSTINPNPDKVRLVLAYDSEMNQAGTTKDEVRERFAHINVRYRSPENSLDGYRETRARELMGA